MIIESHLRDKFSFIKHAPEWIWGMDSKKHDIVQFDSTYK